MTAARPRVAFDANVIIAAVRSPRWPYEVLQSALSERFDLFLPVRVIEEARRHAEGHAQVQFLESFLRNVRFEALPNPSLSVVAAHADLVRSQKDVPIALALLLADVDVFVSNDRDFTDPGATAPRFRDRVRVMLPAVFLREIVGWSAEALEAIRNRTWDEIPAEPDP